jgi:hypothetical protein
MPVDGDAIFLSCAFHQISGDPNLVTGSLCSFRKDLEFPLTSGNLSIDPFYIDTCLQAVVEVF